VVEQIPAERIVWVDETGIEERLFRSHARAALGQRCLSETSGKRVGRTTLIAGYGAGVLKAPMRFKGYTNTQVFNAWCEEVLAPELVPGQFVIMDSASFHKSKATRNIIEATGAKLLFQPKYSPDCNKSEPQWANLKRRIRSDNSHDSFIQKLDKHIQYMCNHSVN
jgi:transposase